MKKFLTHDTEYGDQEEYSTEKAAITAAKKAIADGMTGGPVYVYQLLGYAGEKKRKAEEISYTEV